ncbi:methyl-accepting chemotaxis protein [Telmatospirillum sp. J64-1]|uniref:methyl-accepting chemotaxis protein n=1 Tax=Telmatospirillum sp. J64-1 TaxID=2502183 RepID=UPI00115C6AA9|nr:methyl-accepting chemotaxis protein [Telmatospirillum sp. J64-1]
MPEQASPTFSFWNRLRIGGKLMSLCVLFVGVLVVLVVFTVMAINERQSATEENYVTGRQRYLAQRYYIDIMHQLQTGEARRGHVWLDILRSNASALANGGTVVLNADTGESIQVNATPYDDIRAQFLEQRTIATQLQQAMSAILANPDAVDPVALSDANAILDQLLALTDDSARLRSDRSADALNRIASWMVLLGASAAVIGLLGTWMLVRNIVTPLQRGADMARAIASGDLTSPPLKVQGEDETAILSRALNEMQSSLRMLTQESRQAAERLSAAVYDIMSSVQEQAATTRQQAAAVQEITATVEELSQSARQVADMARDVSSSADTVAASGASGLQAVQDSTAAMEAIRSQTESVAENIIGLSERMQTVGEIIASVNEIAERSNLVALNAAIEAADARDQGRRFSVVADEIKNLADQSKDATRQVRSILEQTQKGINTSVMLTEEALKRVTAGREKTLQAEEFIRQMAGDVQESAGSFQQVVGATNQQQIGFEQIAQALHQIRQASMQTATSTDELAKASSNLRTLGESLARNMEKYRL